MGDVDAPEVFPIGYTITFSPPPPARRHRGRAGSNEAGLGPPDDAPRGGTGCQVLPVAQRLSDRASGPVDGAEYLCMVRQEAHDLPQVVRRTRAMPAMDRTLVPDINAHSARPASTPSPQWTGRFLHRLCQLRKRVLPLPSASSLPTIPAPRDESNWRVFIDGKIRKPETPGSAADRPPMMPEPNLVTALNQVTVMSVLEHLTLWLEARLETGGADTLPRNQGAWILALLAVLSDVLTADDISSLRRLARSCQAVTQRGSTDERALAWCVIVAVAGVWGQHDLLHPS